MTLVAIVLFFASLCCIIALFCLKVRELETGRFVAPRLRSAADRKALHIKELLFAVHVDLKKIPPIMLYLLHVAIHSAALNFASMARSASRKSHQLADFVSHKRNFAPKQTRSEFLRQMSKSKQDGEMDRTGTNE